MLDPRDKCGWQAHALECRTKYVRILRRTVNGRVRWYAQLIQDRALSALILVRPTSPSQINL
jgi:hypothetical protein